MHTYLRRIVPGGGLAVLCGMFLGCGGGDGLTKHPVTGTVLVNGKPQAGIVVRFHATNPTASGNAASPAGVTDENGSFTLSTNGKDDGAVAGEYAVTFSWTGVSANGSTPTPDRFGGRFGNPAASQFKATVSEGPNRVGPYQLTADPAKLERPPAGIKGGGPPQ